MQEHRNQTFHNRTLILDGQHYLGCRFINADLRYKGTALFEMQGSRFEGYFNLEWDRQGADALAMVQMLDRQVQGCGFDLELASRLARWSKPVWRFHTLLPRSCEPSRAFDVDTAHRFGGRPHASPTDCVMKGCEEDV